MLSINNHDRDSAGLKYVYPVISRRSGGLSIGINLNPNNACNWHCIYCQVPNLKRGSAAEIDLKLFAHELESFIEDVLRGDFYRRFNVAEELQSIKDIAISGNGEPTSAKQFSQVIDLIGEIASELKDIKRVLITNGSLIQQAREGLKRWNEMNGEIWFKLDSATQEGMQRINQVSLSPQKVMSHLAQACDLAPTWLQTCLFSLDSKQPSIAEQQAYLAFIEKALRSGIPLQGILLYGIARTSQQAEAQRLSKLSEEWIQNFADQIRALEIEVKVSV